MSGLYKQIKVPTEYDAVEWQKIIEQILGAVQEKNMKTVDAAPESKNGRNGEMWIDEKNDKIYVKIKGAWKSASLT